MTDNRLAVFENYKIRRHYDEQKEIWYFSVVDIIQVLIQQADYQTARKYWNKLKERLRKEGSESVTKCHRLKLKAADGKNYLADVADPETLLRLVQSVPSPKAEPIKLWLAKAVRNFCDVSFLVRMTHAKSTPATRIQMKRNPKYARQHQIDR